MELVYKNGELSTHYNQPHPHILQFYPQSGVYHRLSGEKDAIDSRLSNYLSTYSTALTTTTFFIT